MVDNKMGTRKDGCRNDNNKDGSRTSKFLYKGASQKSDPWRTEQDDGDEFAIQHSTPLNSNKRTTTSPGFDLDNVWSIRKNVQVSSSVKNGTALKTTGKSFYSRHGGLTGKDGLNTSSLSKKPKIEDHDTPSTFESKSWSVPRQGYSYSDRFSYNNNTDTNSNNDTDLDREFGDIIGLDSNKRDEEEDFETKKNRINTIRIPMPGAPQIAAREMSARTRKAHKAHEGYLKASGLGQYSSSSGPYSRQIDENDKVKWEKGDEFS